MSAKNVLKITQGTVGPNSIILHTMESTWTSQVYKDNSVLVWFTALKYSKETQFGKSFHYHSSMTSQKINV